MSLTCANPDTSIGVALRLSGYMNCQARALGENGFQAMVGGPVAAGLLSAVVTLFVALIGYRLLVGERIGANDAIGWAVRLGIVLALVTGWPAFQTLVYGVAVDGPVELASVLLPAAGLQSDGLDQRVQAAYDTLRLGGAAPRPATDPAPTGVVPASTAGAGASAAQPEGLGPGQTQRPTTALLLVLGTIGLTSALRIAVGFLLAIAPLPILALLFDATTGFFVGWVGTLGGAALAVLATTIVSALELLMVEGEIASLQSYSRGLVAAVNDPEALVVLVVFFGVASLVAAGLAMRSTGLLRSYVIRSVGAATGRLPANADQQLRATDHESDRPGRPGPGMPDSAPIMPSRAILLAGTLTQVVNRERVSDEAARTLIGNERFGEPGRSPRDEVAPRGYGAAGRRVPHRKTRSAASRDRAR